MTLSLFDRLGYNLYNLGYALIGPPTSVFVAGLVMYLHHKYMYLFFGLVCIGFMIYYLYQFFSNAAANATQTQIIGDPAPANDYYLFNVLILAVYLFISYQGFTRPERVNNYRTRGTRMAQQAHRRLSRRRR